MYGPVYPNVYKWFVFSNSNYEISDKIQAKFDSNEKIQAVCGKIFKVFKNWTAGDLSTWTHKDGTPWRKALDRNNGDFNCVIDKDDMRKYFKEMLAKK